MNHRSSRSVIRDSDPSRSLKPSVSFLLRVSPAAASLRRRMTPYMLLVACMMDFSVPLYSHDEIPAIGFPPPAGSRHFGAPVQAAKEAIAKKRSKDSQSPASKGSELPKELDAGIAAGRLD